MTEKELAINGQPIRSNDDLFCARCGMLIVEANRSEYEVFVEGGLTQPICIFCDAKDSDGGPKAQDTDAPPLPKCKTCGDTGEVIFDYDDPEVEATVKAKQPCPKGCKP